MLPLTGSRPVEPSVYKIGEGTMVGAFGIPFSAVLKPDWIVKRPGWVLPGPLPREINYYGPHKYKQLAYQVKPPDVPRLFKRLGVTMRYTAYVDFNEMPVWISAQARLVSCEEHIEELLEILGRKYETMPVENNLHRFTDGKSLLQLSCSEDAFTMGYFHLDGFKTYVDFRNQPLMNKIRQGLLSKLTEDEIDIANVAKNLNIGEQRTITSGFGIPLDIPFEGHYVADQLTSFDPPNPLNAFAPYSPVYELQISPEGMPIRVIGKIRLGKTVGTHLKWLLDEALRLIFGGHEKHSRLHTVITSRGRMIVVRLTRKNWLLVTYIDSAENKSAGIREEQRLLASQAAKAEEIRRREIKEEKGF